jgi:hypothetical protein
LPSGVTWVLVVSNINLKKNVQSIKPTTFLQSSSKGFTLNINNDYRYLKTGYYVSMHAEILGNAVIPSSKNIIDASRTPILLLKARKAGIPTLPNLTTGSVKQILSETRFPIVVFPVNPFMYNGFKIARNRSALYRAVKSLGMNYKFGILSKRVYETFSIPICKLHVQRVEKEVYLCGLQPLKKEEIFSDDLEIIAEEIVEMSKTVRTVG